MPNIKSAKKRVAVIEKKTSQNKMIKSAVKTAIKKYNAAIAAGDIAEAEKLLPVTVSAIDSAASKGILHKNNAANKKSALAKKLNEIRTSAPAAKEEPVGQQGAVHGLGADKVHGPARQEVQPVAEEAAPAPKKTRAKKKAADAE